MANPQPTQTSLQLARQPEQSPVSMTEWAVIREQATMLVKTGFLPQAIKTPEQALAIILTGRELGIGPMAALRSIDVIQGKPTVSPQLMLALVNRTGELEQYSLTSDEQGATCTIKRRGQEPKTTRFGSKQAAALGLLNKDNYKKQPQTMYEWRAIAGAVRKTFPDAILGLYTPEEMGAMVDLETGESMNLADGLPTPLQQILSQPQLTDEEWAALLVPYTSKVNGVYEVVENDLVFTVSKGAAGSICDCGSSGAPLCRHRLAASYWANAQKPTPVEADAEAVEPFNQPPIDPHSPAKLSRSQLISICEATTKLETLGVDTDSWRDLIENLVGVRSRKEIPADEFKTVLDALTGAIGEIERKRSRKNK